MATQQTNTCIEGYEGEGHMTDQARALTRLDVDRQKQGITRPITREDLIAYGVISETPAPTSGSKEGQPGR